MTASKRCGNLLTTRRRARAKRWLVFTGHRALGECIGRAWRGGGGGCLLVLLELADGRLFLWEDFTVLFFWFGVLALLFGETLLSMKCSIHALTHG